MIAPILVGSTFSWSLTNIKGIEGNVKPLGFPLNQYFPFFVLSLIGIIGVVICSRIPSYLDKSQRLNEENLDDKTDNLIDLKCNKITHITVGSFIPN